MLQLEFQIVVANFDWFDTFAKRVDDSRCMDTMERTDNELQWEGEHINGSISNGDHLYADKNVETQIRRFFEIRCKI